MTRSCSGSVDFYSSFAKGDCLITNARTAEMTKLTENTSRDVGIAFNNELSVIYDQLGIDVRTNISCQPASKSKHLPTTRAGHRIAVGLL